MYCTPKYWSSLSIVRLIILVLAVATLAACSDDTSNNTGDLDKSDAADVADLPDGSGAPDSSEDAELPGPVFVEIVSGPESHTNQTSVAFELTCNREAGCTFECSLDAGPEETSEFSACPSTVTYENLSDGDHIFRAVALDDDGISSEAETWEWSIDTESPVVEITEAPASETADRSAHFEFKCTNEESCIFECALDDPRADGSWESCSSPHILQNLGYHDYTLRLRATDLAGNQGFADHDWTIEWTSRVTVSINYQHTCAIAADATLWCWGYNWQGTLGDGTFTMRNSPVQVGSDTDWAQIRAGSASTCGLRDNHSLWCWGHNAFGEMGDGTTGSKRPLPGQVGSETNWAQASNAGVFNCSRRADQTLWCWGHNDAGQLGDGTTTDRHSPVQIGTNADWTHLSAGYMNTVCAIRADKTLWCWGENSRGLVGDGTLEERHAPVQVGSDANWAHVSVGGGATCGLRDDGTLWCWGADTHGIVGEDRTDRRLSPMQIGSRDDWSDVVVGARHACAIRTDRTLWCWGSDASGALAQPTASDQNAPVQVGSDADWMHVSAGFKATCGVRADETVWCWGENGKGQVGNGTETDQHSPVQVLDGSAP